MVIRNAVFAAVAAMAVLTSGTVMVKAVSKVRDEQNAAAVAAAARRPSAKLGAYTGPATKGVAGLRAWEEWSGVTSPYGLDYAAGDSWFNITGPTWMLEPWRDSGKHLVLSVPLMPNKPGDTTSGDMNSLRKCASGAYDLKWSLLGRNLVKHELQNAIIRPGWEFDGTWYAWAAEGQQERFVKCFQNIVTAMRKVAGQHFEFLWNPTLGRHAFPAEQAYPGNEYVDYIGVDVYDESWRKDTYKSGLSANPDEQLKAAQKSWGAALDGPGGLRFWADYAMDHGKQFALPEWGLSQRPDGRGGGDNPYFAQKMLEFIGDPRNSVAFAMYFDVDSETGRHQISKAASPFKSTRAQLPELMQDAAGATRRRTQE
jgi:hypothetical protein